MTLVSKRHQSSNVSSHKFDVKNLLETWTYEVNSRGSLTAVLPFDTVIKPLSPQDYPYMNKVFLGLYFNQLDNEKVPNAYELGELSDVYDLKVTFDEDKANMNIKCDLLPGVTLPVICHLQVPIQSQLNIKMLNKSNLTVERMESSSIDIFTETGNCFFRSIKCLNANVSCKSGNIVSKSTFLGDIVFHTSGVGSIQADKLQGSSIECITEIGSINIASVYSKNSLFKSETGEIHLGNVHGNLCMKAQKSILKIDSLEGDLDVSLQSGKIDAHLSKHEKADIAVSNGDVNLSFTENVNTDLSLNGSEVTIDEKFDHSPHNKEHGDCREGYIGKRGISQTNVSTLSGTIYIKMLDWIQTTKLAILMQREKNS